MEIILIAAIGKNNELGKNNHLIWSIKEDMEFFKKKTMGKTIVMGRKTFESLPKLLPKRKHIVLSTQKGYHPEGVIVYHSTQELLENVKEEEIFIIGGSQIYQAFLKHATKMYLTEIDKKADADTFFPLFSANDWERKELSQFDGEISYKHVEYIKRRVI